MRLFPPSIFPNPHPLRLPSRLPRHNAIRTTRLNSAPCHKFEIEKPQKHCKCPSSFFSLASLRLSFARLSLRRITFLDTRCSVLSLATPQLTIMVLQRPQDRPRRPLSKIGFFRSYDEFLASYSLRDRPAPFEKPPTTTFGYSWEAHPTSPCLLVNPGLDPRDPLACGVAPRQLKTFIGNRYNSRFGHQLTDQKTTPSYACGIKEATKDKPNEPSKRPTKTFGQRQNIFKPIYPNAVQIPTPINNPRHNLRAGSNLSVGVVQNANKQSFHEPFVGQQSTSNTVGLRTFRFRKASQAEFPRRATAYNSLASKATCIARFHRPRRGSFVPVLTSSTVEASLASKSCGLKEFDIRPKEERKPLFGPVRSSVNRPGNVFFRTKGFATKDKSRGSFHTKHKFGSNQTLPSAPATPAGAVLKSSFLEWNTAVVPPHQPTLVELNETSGTTSFVAQGSCFRTITIQPAGQQGHPPSADRGSACNSISRKRRAEDSELDLIVANAAEQTQRAQGPFMNIQAATGLDLDEQNVRCRPALPQNHTNKL